MNKHLPAVVLILMALTASAETYRIAGKVVDEADLKDQYSKVETGYILYNNALAKPEQVGAVRQKVEVLSVIDPYTVLVKVEQIVSRSEKPDGAMDQGSRKGREFTIAETDARLTANMQIDDRYALRLREKSTDLPLTKSWDVWVCDSKTFVEVKKKDRSKVKVRILYDVTMRFEDFVRLLQSGQVFPELAKP
jgi:hypothetical protein